jgi:hypothetical protein
VGLVGGAAWSGCSADLSASALSGPPPKAGTVARAIRFEESGVVTVEPGKAFKLIALVEGDAPSVRFGLEGLYQNASIAAAEVAVAEGRAEATLRAPTVPTTFSVRASLDEVTSVRAVVSVSDRGYGAVRVIPRYPQSRALQEVRTSASVGGVCADLVKPPLADGAPVVVGQVGVGAVLDNLPAKTPLAIVARAGGLAVGCAELDGLEAGSTRDIELVMTNTNVELEGTSFAGTFDWNPDSHQVPAFAAGYASMSEKFLAPFQAPPPGTDGAWLLERMQGTLTPADAELFQAERQARNWDTAATTWTQGRPPTFRARVADYLDGARAEMLQPIEFQLVFSAQRTAELSPRSFGQLPALAVDLKFDSATSASLDATDRLTVATSGQLSLGSALAAAADAVVRRRTPPLRGIAEALTEGVDCAGFARSLGPQPLFGSCDAACGALMCTQAIERAVDEARRSIEKTSFELSANGPVALDDMAHPSGWSGTFVAGVRLTGARANLSGTFVAKP